MVLEAAYAINEHKKELNDLNVFPVPDGDTGINMSLTMNSAAAAIENSKEVHLGKVADIVALALLRGARGNSGVILSLLFRGLSKRLRDLESADSVEFSEALVQGVEAAYNAVMKPSEGTILTVSRKASAAALDAAKATNSIRVSLNSGYELSRKALSETVEQNPVLKKAGVVDAGAAGYVYILEAFLRVAREEPSMRDTSVSISASESIEATVFEAFDTEDIKFTYCTEFIIERNGEGDPSELRDYLESIGDCVVVVPDEEIIKVHVHTNNPGLAIEKALTLGMIDRTKIDNMKLQHSSHLGIEKKAPAEEIEPEDVEFKTYGFVSVAAGDGLADVFKDLGVDRMVNGGQTMNPSTEDILSAVNLVPADTVFVLPNNKNIIMAAQQVEPLTDKRVIVIPTRSVPQGISAMISFDPEGSAEDNEQQMTEAAMRVHTGQVTYAARDSSFEDRRIKEGDYIALLDNKLLDSDKRQHNVLRKLVRELTKPKDVEFVTIIYGEGISEEEALAVKAQIEKDRRDVEVSIIYGGQPVYYYIISAE
ncbi:MAG: DAK2 domain-containing protein [Clostridiales bacterium]|nr:DAK2 domain-containing protein [Clostridiales bacterium]